MSTWHYNDISSWDTSSLLTTNVATVHKEETIVILVYNQYLDAGVLLDELFPPNIWAKQILSDILF
jgi:hypothetical protein